jgi:hypothetical protein
MHHHVRIRLVALGVLATLTAFALAASSASALPEFGQCFKHPTHEGKYTNSVCTKKAPKVEEKFTGEFEWRKASAIEAAKKKFSGTGGEVGLRILDRLCEPEDNTRAQNCPPGETENVGNVKFTCASEVNSGEISGSNAAKNVKITFKGCGEPFGGGQCSNTATEGEVVLNGLKGKLGFINKQVTPREVGLLLEPATAKGKFFTTTKCSNGVDIAVGIGNEAEGCVYPQKLCGGDGVISTIGPVNTATSEFTQVFTENGTTGENIPTKFEGATKPLKLLEAFLFAPGTPTTSMWSKFSLSLTNSDKMSEAFEIKAN